MCPLYEVVLHVERSVIGLDLYTILEIIQYGAVQIDTEQTLAQAIVLVLTILVGECVFCDDITANLGAGSVISYFTSVLYILGHYRNDSDAS